MARGKRALDGLDAEIRAHLEREIQDHLDLYRPFQQMPAAHMFLVVRTSHDPTMIAASLRGVVGAADPTVPASEIRSFDQLAASSVAASRFTTLLLAGFAVVALGLAAIGVYGVLSYSVSGRTREIGVRLALGARRADVLRLVLGNAMLLASAGIACGVGAAVAATGLLEGLLFGVTATDPFTFAVVPAVLGVVAHS